VDREALLGRELSRLLVRLRDAEGADLAFGDAPGQMALDTGQPVGRKTIGWVRADGTTLWLEVSAESVSPEAVLVSFADITSRKQAEDDLRRSEDRFSRAFHASPDSVNVNRLSDGVYLEVNEGFSRMTGYSAAECLGRSVSAGGLDLWVNQADRERMKAQLCATGRITGMEAAFRKKDGSVLVGLFSASLMEVDGEPCVLSLTRDISELRAQARQLERMTQLYAALSQVNQAIVWAPKRQALMDRICMALVEHGKFSMAWIGWQDPATRAVTVASSYGDRDGYLEGALVGSDETPFGPGPVGTALRAGRPCIVNDFLGSEQAEPWRSAALRSRFAAMGAFPIRIGGVVCGVLAVYAGDRDFFGDHEVDLLEEAAGDVSFALEHQDLAFRREEAEAALRQQKAEFETIFNLIPLAICYKDTDHRYIRVNDAACGNMGLTREQIEGRTTGELFPASAEVLCREDQEVMATVRAKLGILQRLRMAGGDLRQFRANKVPVIDAQGEVSGLIAIMEDITEQQRIEASQRSLEEQLQQSQKMQSLGQLAGGIAHDMNNVLAAILGLASAHRLDGPENSSTEQAFETISKAAARGGKMVKRLLSFARQIPAEVRALDLNAMIREEVELLERTLLSHIGLEMDLEPDLRPIRGDASNLSNALLNLCVNAGDAMPENGTLSLRTRNLADGWVEVQVEDTGSGMTDAVLAKALDPFFTTKPQGKGTGLGLSMVYGAVQAHGGRLDIQSRPGVGTRVSLRFPAGQPVPPGAGLPERPEQPSLPGSLTMLLVDDDELVRMSLMDVLQVLGHQATAVASGEEAIHKLEAGFQPQVIILDMNMPGLGGAGTLPRLRALLPEVPILLTTGQTDQKVLDLIQAHPAVNLLAKPFNIEELQQVLTRIAAGSLDSGRPPHS